LTARPSLSTSRQSPAHHINPTFFLETTKMARWTENFADLNHIADISRQIPIGDIAHIALKDGTTIEGIVRRVNLDNNAGQGGWKYCGECEVEKKDHSHLTLDFLDIKAASSLWDDPTAAEYERLGLISIVR
jgi:hypothetical protein